MRVLLLGASGLVGGAITRALLRGGHELIAAARRPPTPGAPHLHGLDSPQLAWRCADLDASPEPLADLAAGCAAIVCAAISPLDPDPTPHRAALRAQHLAWATRRARVHRLLLLGCASTAGTRQEPPPDERELLLPGVASSRVDAMLAAEGEVLAANSTRLYASALLTTNPFGDHDPRPPERALLPALASLPLAARPADLQAHLTHVEDIARSVHAALQQGRPGQRYLLSGRTLRLPPDLLPAPRHPAASITSLPPLEHLRHTALRFERTKSRVELGHSTPKLDAALQSAARTLSDAKRSQD